MKKSELRQLIREMLHEELKNKKLKESSEVPIVPGGDIILTWDNQINFKKYYKRYTGEKDPKFYFDGIYCVDKNTDKNIENVNATGELTYEQAAKRIETHFKRPSLSESSKNFEPNDIYNDVSL